MTWEGWIDASRGPREGPGAATGGWAAVGACPGVPWSGAWEEGQREGAGSPPGSGMEQRTMPQRRCGDETAVRDCRVNRHGHGRDLRAPASPLTPPSLGNSTNGSLASPLGGWLPHSPSRGCLAPEGPQPRAEPEAAEGGVGTGPPPRAPPPGKAPARPGWLWGPTARRPRVPGPGQGGSRPRPVLSPRRDLSMNNLTELQPGLFHHLRFLEEL